MAKSPDAFRTISEVAEWLGVQAHVLRFWESKFTQVKPIKRAGGRRYYRPADMLLLGGIKRLLHEDGLTIKGVQKLLREEGMSHVAALSMPLDDLTMSEMATDSAQNAPAAPAPEPQNVVLPFEPPREVPAAAATAPEIAAATDLPPSPAPTPGPDMPPDPAPTPGPDMPPDMPPNPGPEDPPEPDVDPTPEPENVPDPEPDVDPTPEPQNIPPRTPPDQTPEIPPEPDVTPDPEPQNIPTPTPDPTPPGPGPEIPQPRDIGMPAVTAAHEIGAQPATLAASFRARRLDADTARQMAPLLARLASLRDTMAAQRGRPGA